MTYLKTTTLPVSPDDAFALITQPERLRRWMAVSAYVDLRAGGDYRWTVTPGHHVAGTIHEVEPGRRLVFGWGWEGDDALPTDASTVTVTIEPSEGGSLVTLEHAGLPEALLAGHAEGWDHFFERLERVAGFGDAGQDDWAWAPENLTPTVAAEAALAVVQPVLRNLTQADRPKPTPCSEFTCHELAEHLMTSLEQLGGMAGATVTRPEDGSLEHKVSMMADQAITAWRGVDLAGTVPGPGGEMPAGFAAGILPVEILLHGWDLAQATGQSLRVSDEVVAYVAELAGPLVDGGRGRAFGDEVAASDDSSPIERLAAFAGRVPVGKVAVP